MTLIIGLILFGLVLISFEIIVPGGILGFLGALSFIGACVVAFKEYGAVGGTSVFIGSVVMVIIALALELKFLPKTKIGKGMFLRSVVEDKSTQDLGTEELIGKQGEVLTELAPTGRVRVEEKIYEAFSKDGLIKPGETVEVMGSDNFRIIVKKV